MSKVVNFGLGPALGLSARTLTITPMTRSGETHPLAAVHSADAGSTATTASVLLDSDRIFQAKLVDTKTTGEVSDPDVLTFNTGSLQFPGPKTGDRLSILSMEDNSSSSSSSNSSSSTS